MDHKQGKLDLELEEEPGESEYSAYFDEDNLEKAIKLESKIYSGVLDSKLVKVGYILNHYPETRNSDIDLQLKYWEIFQSDIYKGGAISREDYKKRLERLTIITRNRAKIVNEYGLYHPTIEDVKRHRKQKGEDEREKQLLSKPDAPSITMYCDESGKAKDNKYLLVGSLWIYEKNRAMQLHQALYEFKKDNKLDPKFEFHFTEMKNWEKDLYINCFKHCIKNIDMISFMAVAVERSKLRSKSISDAIIELYNFLVDYGIEHEITNSRISLPRNVVFFKDKDNATDDALMLGKLKQFLENQFAGKYNNQLYLERIFPADSFASPQIQLADIFTGSVGRILNFNKNQPKDEVAKEVLSVLGIDRETLKSKYKDLAMIKILE